MIRQQIKNIYFSVNRWAAVPNTVLIRYKYQRSRERGSLYLHLGSGADYKAGFVNVEGNIFRKHDCWLDLRNRLPFPDKSTCFVYSSHTLEHLYPDESIALLREIGRVLIDNGVARIAVPSMEHALHIASGDASAAFPRPFEDTLAQAINYLFCDGQHKYGYSFGLLKEFATQAGFGRIANYSAQSGVSRKQYGRVEVGDEPAGSLVVELRR
jgi:predicted SAM-dependent methyltransferase